jgi:peptidoglycan hydrolase-like protein with peptidoglycan-binding domain
MTNRQHRRCKVTGCASQLQAELNAYDNAGLTVDHVFGDATRLAVIRFQQGHGVVPADGIVGSETKAVLNAAAGLQPAPGPPPAPAPSTQALPLSYAALGDSYSAGEGLADSSGQYQPGSGSCHRSDQAYSQYVTPRPDVFRACSGQKIAGLEGEMANNSRINSGTGLVTLTIGGNDLYWSNTVTSCLKFEDEVFHVVLYETRAACLQSLDDAAGRAGSLEGQLFTAYAQLLKAAPNAQVRVLTYPPMFPDRGNSTSGCRIGRVHPAQLVIASDVELRFVSLEQQANLAVIRAVQSVRTSVPGGDPMPWALRRTVRAEFLRVVTVGD